MCNVSMIKDYVYKTTWLNKFLYKPIIIMNVTSVMNQFRKNIRPKKMKFKRISTCLYNTGTKIN